MINKILLFFITLVIITFYGFTKDSNIEVNNLKYTNDKALVIYYSNENDYNLKKLQLRDLVNISNFIKVNISNDFTAAIYYKSGKVENFKLINYSTLKNKIYGNNGDRVNIEANSWGEIKELFK